MVAPVLQFGLPGTQEMLIILLVLVLLFGANKIPKLARSTGQAMGEFQKGREEVEQELEEIKEGGTGDVETDVDADTTTTTAADDEVEDVETSTVDATDE